MIRPLGTGRRLSQWVGACAAVLASLCTSLVFGSDKQLATTEQLDAQRNDPATARTSGEPIPNWRSSGHSGAASNDLQLRGVVLRVGYEAGSLALISANGASTLMLAGADLGGRRTLLHIASDHVIISSPTGLQTLNLDIFPGTATSAAAAVPKASVAPTRVVLAAEKAPRVASEEATD